MLSVIILVVMASVDIAVKNYIEKNYTYTDEKKIMAGLVTVRRSSNKGAFLGLLKNCRKILKAVTGILIAVLFIIYAVSFVMKKGMGVKAGIAFILAGAVSNEYDRIKKGSVTDYFSINLPFIKHIVFNIGDFSIFVGVILLFLSDTAEQLR